MVVAYVPEKGDLVWLNFTPQAGHEQRGRRPGLVVSNKKFNRAAGMCFTCPITNTDRKSPFRLEVPAGCGLTGFIMVDQVKSLDYKARKVEYHGRLDGIIMADVLGLIDAIVFQD